MIFFRADGNEQIGSGHVMRCLSIAGRVPDNICFITADSGIPAIDRVVGKNNHHILGLEYRKMESELNQMSALIEEYQPKALFVDSYYVTDKYLKDIKEICEIHGTRLVYIDDLLAFPYPCHTLINYNIYAKEEAYKELYGEDHPRLLLGPIYAPLRKEFRGLKHRIIRSETKDILVSTGGADSNHVALRLVREIDNRMSAADDNWIGNGIQFHFLLPSLNSDIEEIQRIAARMEGIIELHINETHIAELMQKCDLAIAASGSTLYELCAAGTPTITYVIADNQIPGARGFKDTGLMDSAGDIRECDSLENLLLESCHSLAEDYKKRMELSERMQQAVDGKGAERIIERLMTIMSGI